MIKERFKKSIRGFTLIELLIVIAIIGVLATLLMVNFVGVRQRARDAQRKSDLRQMQSALEIYRSDQASYPISLTNCTCNGSACFGAGSGSSCSPIYMQKIPADPSGSTSYYYWSDGTIYKLGACLENIGDSQKDTPTNITTYGCNGTTNWSFTLNNP